ncbi:MAG: WD40 repeat domain-containing protein [Treponema sp.]|jgi:hypothetical protein|nr:WD40 repeat domain-containing protein [Treponema sp.]
MKNGEMEGGLTKKGRKYWIFGGIALFIVYNFAAARPIPQETIMVSQWFSSLESGYTVSMAGPAEAAESDAAGTVETPGEAGGDPSLIPFRLGDRFGYVTPSGGLRLNRVKARNLFLSAPYWAEYEAAAEAVDILGNSGEKVFTVEGGRGYPFFLDGRLFLVGKDMDTLGALDGEGKLLWSHDFAAPLTCVDGAAGYVLTGSLDGVVEILDREGKQFFYFPPGGSRLPVILGCAISQDGNRLGIVSGIDDQRFLLLERYGDPARGEFRVVYHEFLEDGFRRPVHIAFIDGGSRVAYERQGGLGIYDLQTKTNRIIPLEGEIAAMDSEGSEGVIFVIVSQGERQKELVGIKLSGGVILRAPFRSEGAFFHRSGPRLYLGGGNVLAAFEMGRG